MAGRGAKHKEPLSPATRELANLLADASPAFHRCPSLLAQLEPLMGEDGSVAEVLREEVADLLDDPGLGGPLPDGHLLAARWLLRLRAYAYDDALRDAFEMVPKSEFVSPEKVAKFNKTASRYVAYHCLKWHQDWRNEYAAKPHTMFGSGAPRTKDVAIALGAAIEQRFDRLKEDPAFFAERQGVWDSTRKKAFLVEGSSGDKPAGDSPVESFPTPAASLAGEEAGAAPETASRTHRLRGRIKWHRARGETSIKPSWSGMIPVLSVLGTVLLGGWSLIQAVPWAQAMVADQVEIRNVTPAPKFAGERFWVPANAPLDSLPVAEVYCGGPTVEGGMTGWLKEHASYQNLPQQITIRNLSHAEDLITMSEVTAHGQTTEPMTPGFFVDCPSGGVGGGDIQWSFLRLRLADGEQATLLTNEPSSYFSRVVGKGTSAGLILDLDSDMDFHGTVSIKLEQTDHETSTVTLPPGAADSQGTFDWHGVPRNKFLGVSPGRQGSGAFLCKYSSDDNASFEQCTLAQIKQRLDALWGAEALK